MRAAVACRPRTFLCRPPFAPLSTIDLFCGAGGITEGFREAGHRCLYGNDCMPEAIETFLFNHPETWGEARGIEGVDPADVRKQLGLRKGSLDVLVGGERRGLHLMATVEIKRSRYDRR